MMVDGCSTSSGWVDVPEEDKVEVVGFGAVETPPRLLWLLVAVSGGGGATNRLVVSALRLTPKECCC